MATTQPKWFRPTQATKDFYAIEKQLKSGNLHVNLTKRVTLPAAASLPSSYTSAYYTPSLNDSLAGTEKIIYSGIPFKTGDTWGWLFHDSNESTVSEVLVRCDLLMVRVATGLTILNGSRAYMIASSGLVTNTSNNGANDEIGIFWMEDAETVTFAAGAQSTPTTGDYAALNTILPNGEYGFIQLIQQSYVPTIS